MNNQNAIVHVIAPGETLYTLARKYNTTIESILKENPYLDPRNLTIGDQIVIFRMEDALSDGVSPRELRLMSDMRALLDKQIVWIKQLVVSTVDNLRDTDIIHQKLIKNVIDIGNLFRLYYGNDKADTITNLLKDNVLISREFIKAIRRRDINGAGNYERDLRKNADDISFTLSSMNPYYMENNVREMLYGYVDSIRDIAISRMNGDYAKEADAFDNAKTQTMVMADYLTDGIIEQFHNQFA
jgi:hypothetical protein